MNICYIKKKRNDQHFFSHFFVKIAMEICFLAAFQIKSKVHLCNIILIRIVTRKGINYLYYNIGIRAFAFAQKSSYITV